MKIIICSIFFGPYNNKTVIEDEKYARAETEKYFAEAQREVKDYKEVVQEMKEEITNTKKGKSPK